MVVNELTEKGLRIRGGLPSTDFYLVNLYSLMNYKKLYACR